MLGDNIVRIRELRNMKSGMLAKSVGISPGYLSDIENNIKKNPSKDVLEKIAFVLETNLSNLYSTEEKLELALGSLNEINKTVENYYTEVHHLYNADNADKNYPDNGIELDSETYALFRKMEKLSKKDRTVVEVLVEQLLKEE